MPKYRISRIFRTSHAQENIINAREQIIRFVHEKNGATAIEYGLIAAGIAIALIAVIFSVGNTLEDFFTTVQTWLASSKEG